MISAQDNCLGQSESCFPDMTALLDVIFILLVFLLLTANVAPRALEVSLPVDGNAALMDAAERRSLTITLFAEGDKWGLEKETFSNWQAFEFAFAARLADEGGAAVEPRSTSDKSTPDKTAPEQTGVGKAVIEQVGPEKKAPEIIVAGDRAAPLAKVIKLFSWLQKHELEAAQLLVSQAD